MHDHERETAPAASETDLRQRVRDATGGLEQLVATAEAAQRERAAAATADQPPHRGAPRWTDVFTTQFTEFSNRPR